MSEYVKKISAEEFAAQIAKHFSSSDSPYGHVDAEQVCDTFHAALPHPHIHCQFTKEPWTRDGGCRALAASHRPHSHS